MHTTNDMSDSDLVAQYVQGNQQALAVLVKRFHKTFCNHAYWIVNDADVAKDIAQDSWKLIIDKVETLQKPARFKSWALRIVHRKAIDYTRNQAKQFQQNQSYKVTKSIQELPLSDTSQQKQQLKKAITELSAIQQQVIRLFYVDELSLQEISKLLNISVGTAKSRLYHAREHLKKQIKK
ncbi:RNA polymerase sigma-70 factor (ECF subfamily) [Kordia periserrulae]|uniref:RNA polymerase sigma-70 factor (ECF subfamily) n=1 Tax=Kordia periserrulae TaxID=701523 RepID=A0A2T6C307_9FLAO|nr:RNA polymerase sigma factor [Kordia periserrulae]PTX62627.1 RNA polymerase sigma-70 factor (ECF subfamily) [Kordia periserrulae]